MYKNIEKQTKLCLKDQVAYQPGQVVSKTLVQNDYVSMIYFDGGFSVETIYESGKRIKDIYYQNNEVTRIKEYE